MASINEIQDEIIEEFDFLGDDRENKIVYIMELGQKLPPMDENLKVEENIIKGCQSKVWLSADLKAEKINFLADSNTDVTKGLISMLIRVLNNQNPEEVANADLYFINKIGMDQLIGSQRSNGLTSMIKQIKTYALALGSTLKK